MYSFGGNPRFSSKTNQPIYLVSQVYVLPTFVSIVCVQVPSSRGILYQLFIIIVLLIYIKIISTKKKLPRNISLSFVYHHFLLLVSFSLSVQISVPSVYAIETSVPDFGLKTLWVLKWSRILDFLFGVNLFKDRGFDLMKKIWRK